MALISIKLYIVTSDDSPMDEVDIEITIRLAQNSRISFRELADTLDLSVNAVHKRVQTLQELGIFKRFQATVSFMVFRPVLVLVSDFSQSSYLDKAVEELGKDRRIFKVIMAGGNMIYVHAFLRDLSELQDLLEVARKKGEMINPSFGFFQPPEMVLPPLSSMDYRILNVMKDDARMAVSDIAEELGVTTKTVRRRLSRMEKEGLIALTIDFVPTASSDIITILHLKVSDPEKRKEMLPSLLEKYRPHMIGLSCLFDPHDIVYCNLWTKNMKEMTRIIEDIRKDERVESVVPNIYYNQKTFETWIDDLIRERAGAR
jgi:DNA-binding Lrp family transcriptional regulator